MRRGLGVVVLGMGCATLPTATPPTATLPTATLPTTQQPPTMVTTPSMAPPTPSNRSAPSWWHVNVDVVTRSEHAAMVPRHGEIDVSQWKLEPTVVEQGAVRTIGWGKTHAKWAAFLGALHVKVHPSFSDIYLRSLGASEAPAGVGARPRSVELWWRLTRDGVAKQIAIVERSGDPEFDIAAVQSVLAALPVRVPAELADSIESTAFRWRFSSQPEVACTTYFANVFEAPALAEP